MVQFSMGRVGCSSNVGIIQGNITRILKNDQGPIIDLPKSESGFGVTSPSIGVGINAII